MDGFGHRMGHIRREPSPPQCHFLTLTSSILALIRRVVALSAIGLMVLGYFVAGRWWKGGKQWAMGLLFGVLFIIAATGICVAGCTIVLFSK